MPISDAADPSASTPSARSRSEAFESRPNGPRTRRAGWGQRDLVTAALAAVAAIAAAALYLPHLDTGFASEDFLVLAYLSNKGLIATLRDELVSPWLGLAPVGFWRPVSTFLLGVELRLFGLAPARFHAAHLVLHAVDAGLVALIVARVLRWPLRGGERPGAPGTGPHVGSDSRWIAVAAAALFALHPFHPSAVLFTGAFATLFAATFSLLAIHCFLAAPERETMRGSRRLLDLAALAAFALALGSYEAAAVVPLVLLVGAWLMPHRARAGAPRRGPLMAGVVRVAPFLLMLGGYLALRFAVLGSAVGGYAAFRERFLSSPIARGGDLLIALGRVAHPYYGAAAAGRWVWALGAALALAGLGLAARRAAPSASWRSLSTGVAWTVLFLAPFAFVDPMPATGRYAYLAIAGAALAVSATLAAIARRRSRPGAAIVAIAFIAVAADWGIALRHVLGAHDEASSVVSAVRSDLIGVAAEHAPDHVVILVDDPPDFVKGDAGEPLAKVLQYGLAQSVRPPFGPIEGAPIALAPAIAPGARAALDALPNTARYRWDDRADRLIKVAPSTPPAPVLAMLSFDPDREELEATCRRCGSARLVLLTAALPFVLEPLAIESERAVFAVSRHLLSSLATVAAGPAFVWVEERADGGTIAMSPIARFNLDGEAARSLAEAAAKIRRDSADGAAPRDDR